jgi:cytoskeletal protein RodZ
MLIGTIVLVVVLLAIGVFYFYPMINQSGNQGSTTTSSTSSPPSGTGRVVFAISDAKPNMNSITSIVITVDSVQIHSSSQGWVTVSSTAKNYDLIQIKNQGTAALVADTTLNSGDYDQVRLHISNATVTDASGTSDAKLPSGEIKFNSLTTVTSDKITTLDFDFLANETLHVTGNGKYILAPVIHFQSKQSAIVNITGNNVDIRGGNSISDTKVGMNASGNVGVGLKIDDNAVLSIDSSGNIKVGS